MEILMSKKLVINILSCLLAACHPKSDHHLNSVTQSDIQQANAQEAGYQWVATDQESKKEIVLNSSGNFRELNKKELRSYNGSHRKFKTLQYWFDGKTDTTVMVSKIGPVNKDASTYLQNLRKNVVQTYPNAQFQQVTVNGLQGAHFAYTDTAHHLQNACQVLLSKEHTVYSVCAISHKRALVDLEKEIQDINIHGDPKSNKLLFNINQ